MGKSPHFKTMTTEADTRREVRRRIGLRLFLLLALVWAAIHSHEANSALPSATRQVGQPTIAAAESPREPTVPWTFRVLDGDTSELMPARVSIRSLRADGPAEFVLVPIRRPTYYTPEGAEVLTPSIDYRFLGGTVDFFYTPGQSKLDVPKAGFEIWIQKGFEYEAVRSRVIPEPGKVAQFPLKRWINMPQEGWYSGDTHIHMLEGKRLALHLQAEDLHVGNLLLWRLSYGTPVLGPDVPPGQYAAASAAGNLAWVGEEFRNDTFGHLSILDLKKFYEPMTTHGPDRVDFPPMYEGLREFRQQGAMILFSHLGAQPGVESEYPVDVALGMVDGVETFLGWGTRQGLEWWYKLLNCGFRLPAAAGTDRMGPTRIVGAQRVYVKLDSPFSYRAWIENLKQSRSFVTNGPLLFLKVNKKPVGETVELADGTPKKVRVEARAVSRIPFEWLEIIANGQVIYSLPSAPPHHLRAEVQLDVPITRSGWIAARCIGRGEVLFPDIQPRPTLDGFAHTSPVYISMNKKPIAFRESAEFFRAHIRWLQEWVEANYASPSQAEAFLDLFKKADQVYAGIAKKDRHPSAVVPATP